MELERTPIISIRTGEAVKNVKELKQNIQDLKDKIVELRNAEQDCSKETLELQASQRELNAVNGLTKTSTDAVAGSYADLLNQLKEARDAWKQIPQFINGELNPAYTEATNKVRSLTEQVGSMEEATGDWHRSVGHYQNALEGLGQIGTQLTNGLTSLGATFGIAAGQGSIFGESMKGVGIVLKGITIASNVLKAVQKLGDGFKKNTGNANANTNSLKQNTTATKQNATAHVTNTVAEGAETTATFTLKGAIDSLRASIAALGGPFTIIITLATTLISLLPDLISWIGKLGKGSDEASTGLQETVIDPLEQIKIRLEQNNRDRQHALSIAEKEKQSDEEIYQLKLENAKQERQDYLDAQEQARQVLTQKTLEGNKLKENSEEWKKNQEAIEDARKAMDEYGKKAGDLNWQISVGIPETYEAEQTGKAKTEAEKAAEKASEEAKRRAQKALEDAKKAQDKAQEIADRGLKGVDKINREYRKAIEELDNLIASGATGDTIVQARAVLEQELTEKLRAEYKKQYNDRYKGYKQSVDIQRKEADELDKVYRGLIPTLKDTYEKRTMIEEENQRKTKDRLEYDIAVAKQMLANVVVSSKENLEKLEEFNNLSNEGIKALYHDMLQDSEAFAKRWPEPFASAVATIGPIILESESKSKEALKTYVDGLMEAYKEAIEKHDLKAAAILKDKLLGDPPVAEDADLKAAAEDFVKRMDHTMAKEILEGDNPLEIYLKGSNWTDLLETYNQKYRDILSSTTATEAQQYEARIRILEAYSRKYQSFIDSYGSATANVLGATADAWDALLQHQVKNNKMSEEQARKSFKWVKGLQIATAVISTAGAVTQALADPTVPSYYIKAANAVAALATGTAQILKIASTDFSSPGSGGDTSVPTAMQQTPYVPTIGLNTLDYADAQASNPQRVYVLESDITDAQNKQKVRVEESTF